MTEIRQVPIEESTEPDDSHKWQARAYQDLKGKWHYTRERIHDARVCDICDSEDVEQPSELVTGNGWYGGVKILWSSRGGVHGPQVVAVMCRSCRSQHDEAYWTADRRPSDIEEEGVVEHGAAYYCPAHKTDHYEDRMAIEQREAQFSEIAEFIR